MSKHMVTFRWNESDEAILYNEIVIRLGNMSLEDALFEVHKEFFPFRTISAVTNKYHRMRAKLQSEIPVVVAETATDVEPDEQLTAVIDMLREYAEQVDAERGELERLKDENKALQAEVDRLLEIEQEFNTVMKIMAKARDLTVGEAPRSSNFRMDANGNLERYEK